MDAPLPVVCGMRGDPLLHGVAAGAVYVMNLEVQAAFLRSLAQNEYMIDTRYLPIGVRLLEIAGELDDLAGSLAELEATLARRQGE